MHQPVGQLARTRQQQQAFGIQIQPPHGLPFALKQPGQAAKHGRAILRIVVRDDFAGRLVVSNHARRRRVDANPNGLSVDLDGVAKLHALANMRRLGIDGNASFQNQLLHLQPGAQAGLRQHLVKLGGFGLRQEHAFGQNQRHIFLVRIKLARDHIFKPDGANRPFGAALAGMRRRWRHLRIFA